MRIVLALALDTWRQSRQQVVFIIMIAMMALFALASVALPKRFDPPAAGEEPGFGTVFNDEPLDLFAELWWDEYAQAEMLHTGQKFMRPQQREYKEYREALKTTAKAADEVPLYERSVSGWLYMTYSAVQMLVMALFIAACAGYFPGLMAQGAIDAVVSKPVHRLQVFLGKYMGGLLLFAAAFAAFDVVVFLGIGLRTGFWPVRVFLTLPFYVFIAATLYAFLAFFGVLVRKTALPLVLGYVYYVLIDSTIAVLVQLQQMRVFEEVEWLDRLLEPVRIVWPNFTVLNSFANMSVLHLPHFDWGPFATAGVWTVVMLAGGYTIFRRRDF